MSLVSSLVAVATALLARRLSKMILSATRSACRGRRGRGGMGGVTVAGGWGS